MSKVLIESDDGELASASAVLQVRSTNTEYNQPALRIDQASKRGGAASIKIVDPNPDIELVESGIADAAHPARGKYEIAVQSDELQINGRKEDDSGFESIMTLQRPGAGGNIGFRTGSQFGSGRGVIAIANALVAPSVDPAGGGVLYVENAARPAPLLPPGLWGCRTPPAPHVITDATTEPPQQRTTPTTP